MRSSIRHHVDQLLIEQGRFSPIAWLLATGYLSYSNYIDWRDGLIENLDSRFTAPRERIIEQLAIATNYARTLGLSETRGTYLSTEQNELIISRNSQDDINFKTDFAPPQDRMQMDLFFDSAPIYAENELIDAIITRNKRKIPELLDTLYAFDPEKHEDYALLIVQEKKFRAPGLSLPNKLDTLDNTLMPLAVKLLRSEAIRFLTPLWQSLSAELTDCPFDPELPKLHVSYSGMKAFLWHDVTKAIEQEPDYFKQPILLFRYAEASFKQDRELSGLEHWFLLFLLHTEIAEQLIKQTGHHLLSDDWQRFQKLDLELPTQFFPAWILLIKPALAKQDLILNGEAEGFLAFNLAKQLSAEPLESTSIALRADLKKLNPDLFRHFLDSR
ncbi:hypothetical protein [Methylotuvimicrobium sp. KM2]|uniref:hypothetical protein n=1 Tax=Methylotuvimicrobium sp. KM2 TaxID=3133976 RepID=UPI003101932C